VGDEEELVVEEGNDKQWIEARYVGAKLGRERFTKGQIILLTPEREAALEGVPPGTFKVCGQLPDAVIERARANGDLVE